MDRIIGLIYKVPIFRESAKVAINRVQQKIKADYPVQQIKEFAIGDQVLYNDSLNYHGKLKPKQIGLWIIMGILYNRSYKVADHVGV